MKSQVRKTIITILLICASVFAIYSIIWSVYVTKTYSPFVKALHGENYEENDTYFYHVASPSFLLFNGNLAVGESRIGKDTFEVSSVDLIIWPRLNGDYKVMVQVETPKEKVDEYNSHSTMYGIYLNSNLQPDLTNEETAKSYNEHKEFFEENWDKIEKILNEAQSKFNVTFS